jgi:hypothetical protein
MIGEDRSDIALVVDGCGGWRSLGSGRGRAPGEGDGQQQNATQQTQPETGIGCCTAIDGGGHNDGFQE